MVDSALEGQVSPNLHISTDHDHRVTSQTNPSQYLFDYDMSDERNQEYRGYRGSVASKIAGITYRQLDYWARKNIVVPSINQSSGSGTRRLYSFKDIVILAAFKKLLDAGVNLTNATTAIAYLQHAHGTNLSHITIMSDGEQVIECTDSNQVLAFMQTGEAVFALSLAQLWSRVEGSLASEESCEVSLTAHHTPSAKPRTANRTAARTATRTRLRRRVA